MAPATSQGQKQTINYKYYCEVLKIFSHLLLERLNLNKKFILYYNNTCLHTSSKIIAFLTKHRNKFTGHLSYSLDLCSVQFLALSMSEICTSEMKIRHQWSTCCSGEFSLQFYRFKRFCQNVGEVEGENVSHHVIIILKKNI